MIKIISHRGTSDGGDQYAENTVWGVEKVLDWGFEVEVDVWVDKDNNWWLGHNYPENKINFKFLKENSDHLWLHCKDVYTYHKLASYCDDDTFNCFMHENDTVAVTRTGYLWTYNSGKLLPESIAVMPEHLCNNWSIDDIKNCSGVCTDHPEDWKEILC